MSTKTRRAKFATVKPETVAEMKAFTEIVERREICSRLLRINTDNLTLSQLRRIRAILEETKE